jgi:hypothetical protein
LEAAIALAVLVDAFKQQHSAALVDVLPRHWLFRHDQPSVYVSHFKTTCSQPFHGCDITFAHRDPAANCVG